jgi:hypothetical protein
MQNVVSVVLLTACFRIAPASNAAPGHGGAKAGVKHPAQSAQPAHRFRPGKSANVPWGSKERKAILDALRVPLQKEFKQKIKFYDTDVRSKADWAYVHSMARDEKGRKLKQWAEIADPMTSALLRKTKGRWRVVDWGASTSLDAIGDLRDSYPQAPRSIFPSLPSEYPGDGPDGYNNVD